MSDKMYLRMEAHKIFTWYTFNLMQDRKNFVLFLESNRILSTREYDKWVKKNGIMNDTQRILFRKLSDGYVIKKSDCILTLTVSNELLKLDYSEFMNTI